MEIKPLNNRNFVFKIKQQHKIMIMNRKILSIAFVFICIAVALQAQTEFKQLPVLSGEWKLDSILQVNETNSLTAFSPGKIIPENIYFSCPVKIVFNEKDRICYYMYENNETKILAYSVSDVSNGLQFHIEFLNTAAIPERTTDYIVTTTRDKLILTLDNSEESLKTKQQYKYFYSLLK
jgi:hypothetical protein